jgi:hypothetical protein
LEGIAIPEMNFQRSFTPAFADRFEHILEYFFHAVLLAILLGARVFVQLVDEMIAKICPG